MHDYDLASLQSMADSIVLVPAVEESKWVERKWDRWFQAKIEKTYKGILKKGDEVTVEVSGYRMNGLFSRTPFEGKDKPEWMLLFLDVPQGNGDRRPVASGMKLIRKDGVWGFKQRNNPGPYEAVPMSRERGTKEEREKPYLFADLEADLKEAEAHVKEFEDLLSILETPRRNASLLDFLRREPERLGGEAWDSRGSDLMDQAVRKIAEAGEPESCFAAIPLAGLRSFELSCAMKSKDGRDFLLLKLPTHVNAPSERLRALEVLKDRRFNDGGLGGATFDAGIIEKLGGLVGDPDRDVRIAAARALQACSTVSGEIIPGNPNLPRQGFAWSSILGLGALEKAFGTERDGFARYVQAAAVAEIAGPDVYTRLTGDTVGIACGLEMHEGSNATRGQRWISASYLWCSEARVALRKVVRILERFDPDGRVVEEVRKPWEGKDIDFDSQGSQGHFGWNFQREPSWAAGRWRLHLEAETVEEKPRPWKSFPVEFVLNE